MEKGGKRKKLIKVEKSLNRCVKGLLGDEQQRINLSVEFLCEKEEYQDKKDNINKFCAIYMKSVL